MTVVLIVALLVAGISLYDYFSARNWQQVTSSDRNEIVFADRNKEYGAYTMRRDYDKRMVIILVSFIATLGLSFGIFSYIKSIPEDVPEIKPVDVTTIPPAKPEEELPPPPPEPPVPQMEKLTQVLPPVIVTEDVKDIPPVQENLDNAKISTINQDGDDKSFTYEVGPAAEPVVENKVEPILDAVEEDAAYSGNVQSFINSNIIAENLDDANGTIFVKFCVEKDGQLSNISIRKGIGVAADKEAIRIVKLMRGWTAGKQNGKAVRSWYTLPIKIVTE